ncbi:putative non-specific serine/threonine protein kinase [Dioscorea sansibarensis]
MASPMWRRGSIQTLRVGARWLSISPVPTRRFAALWGNGDYGRLGLGGLESRWRPTVCAFFQDDDLPVSIACGGAHTLFLTESGRVYASGLNKFGQLGINSGTSYVLEPVEVFGFSEKVVEISAGYHHSSAITEDGKLFTWGNNSCGQLGLGKRADNVVSTPTWIDCLADIKVSKVALGSEHSIAITDEGKVLSWGAGGSGRLGHGHQSSILGFSMISRLEI